MDAELFKNEYIKNSNISEKYFDEHFIVLPCICGNEDCKGFACVSNDELSIKIHKDLYIEDK